MSGFVSVKLLNDLLSAPVGVPVPLFSAKLSSLTRAPGKAPDPLPVIVRSMSIQLII